MSRYERADRAPAQRAGQGAVLYAVDDLLVEVGFAAMTLAERAGVGRQTVYRSWSTKAEILLEASVVDAEQELAVSRTGDPVTDATAYRALLGEARHDPADLDTGALARRVVNVLSGSNGHHRPAPVDSGARTAYFCVRRRTDSA